MSKTLIIAEKPSVAADFARVLGKLKKPKGKSYYENDDYLVSSAVGHLVELCMPEDMNPKWKSWKKETLPILPEKFGLKVIERNESQFKLLARLMRKKEVERLINACDAGREGELIFAYLKQMAKVNKPVQRLWLSSMTTEAIREGFKKLEESKHYAKLEAAARCRSEADWLIGINGTRAATLAFGRHGKTAATVGRVQTPTLSIICEREEIIENFKPQKYWEIHAEFSIHQGSYTGIYVKPHFKKGKRDADRESRVWDLEKAEEIFKSLSEGAKGKVEEKQKISQTSPPPLYDLTSLQREGNSRFGLPAKRTLSLAQVLYERHKVLTYPRTNSKALPEDYVKYVLEALEKVEGAYCPFAQKVLKNKWVKGENKRIFNNAKVSDHFAIIPTGKTGVKLKEYEQKIYDMVLARFIAVFYPPARYQITQRTSEVGLHIFKTEGKVLSESGYLEVYGKTSHDTRNLLCPLAPQDGKPPSASLMKKELKASATQPPASYTEATLLSAMETAGKFVEDETVAEAMKERGLGTPATRAQTIEHLIWEKYLMRSARQLHPTTKAKSLMVFLKRFGVEALTTPSLTGEWEKQLHEVETGQLTRERFMGNIQNFTQSIVKNMQQELPPENSGIIWKKNGEKLLKDHKCWFSKETVTIDSRAWPLLSINQAIARREMNEKEIQQLLDEGKLENLEGFLSRLDKPFSATLRLEHKSNGTYRTSFDFGEDKEEEEIDLSTCPIVGKSPIDQSAVRATSKAYVSEGKDTEGKPLFRLSRHILGQNIDETQAKKLLEDKKTDLLDSFRSKRTGRIFKAHLILKDKGAIGFEFPPKKNT